MAKPERAGDAPIGVDVVEGKSYYWCTCGKSSKQPFCDGSHNGSEFGLSVMPILRSFSEWNKRNTRTISVKLNKNFEEKRIR